MPDTPLVTVVTPLYNYEKYIASAVESVLAQTYTNLELIVVDDGSTDSGPEIVAAYKDPRIRLLRQSRNGYGVPRAVNWAIREARGEFISWLSADDFYLPEKLARNVEVFLDEQARDPRLGMVHSQPGIESADPDYIRINCPLPAEEINRQLTAQGFVRWKFPALPAASQNMDLNLLMWNQVNGCTTLIPKQVFEAIGYFRDSWAVAHDYELWLRLALGGFSLKYIPDILTVVRFHQVNKGLYQDIVPAEANLIGRFGMELVQPESLNGSLQRMGIEPKDLWLWRAGLFARQQIFDYALVYLEQELAARGGLPQQYAALLPALREQLQPLPATPPQPVPGRYLITLSAQGLRAWRLIAVITHFFTAFRAETPVSLMIWLPDSDEAETLRSGCEAKIEAIIAFLGRSRESLPNWEYQRVPLTQALSEAEVYLPIGNPDLIEQQCMYQFRNQGRMIQLVADHEDFSRARVYEAGRRHWRLSQARPYLWMWPDTQIPLTTHAAAGGDWVFYGGSWFCLGAANTEGKARLIRWSLSGANWQEQVLDWDLLGGKGLSHPVWSAVLAEPIEALALDDAAATIVLSMYDPENRRHWREALAGFYHAAAPSSSLVLYADSGSYDPDAVLEDLSQALVEIGQDPEQVSDLIVLAEHLDERQLAGLYRSCSVIVWPEPDLRELAGQWPALASSGATLLTTAFSPALNSENACLIAGAGELAAGLQSLLAEAEPRRRGLCLKAGQQLSYASREQWLRQLLEKALHYALAPERTAT